MTEKDAEVLKGVASLGKALDGATRRYSPLNQL